MAQKRLFTEFTEEELRQLFREEIRNANLAPATSKGDKRFYPIEWLVEYVGIPKSTIYQMTMKNTIPHIKRGRKLFFDKQRIDQWLEDGNIKTYEEIKRESERKLTRRGRRMRL